MQEVLLKEFKQERNFKLFAAIVIDLVGYISYAVPVFGGVADAFWGPVSGLLIFILFNKRAKKALTISGGIGGAFEEILPVSDFIPTAMILWCIVYIKDRDKTLKIYVENKVNDKKIINESLHKEIEANNRL